MKIENPRQCFAWWPVRLTSGRWVWLQSFRTWEETRVLVPGEFASMVEWYTIKAR